MALSDHSKLLDVGNFRGAAADIEKFSIYQCKAQPWDAEIVHKQPSEVWVKRFQTNFAKYGPFA
jgi:hypothetical protein